MKIKNALLSVCLILSSPVLASPAGQEVEDVSLDALSEENQNIENESESSGILAVQGLENAEEVEKSDNEESKPSLSYYQQAKAYCKDNPRKCVLYAVGIVAAVVGVGYTAFQINERIIHNRMKNHLLDAAKGEKSNRNFREFLRIFKSKKISRKTNGESIAVAMEAFLGKLPTEDIKVIAGFDPYSLRGGENQYLGVVTFNAATVLLRSR